jgi:hypothetical protein
MADENSKLRGKHTIMVVELDAQEDGNKQCLYVSSSSQSPEKFFERLTAKQNELNLPGKPVGLRQELVLGYKPSRSKSALQRRLKETKERLHKLGFEVLPYWRIYVLDVDPDRPKPLLDRGERNHVVYVGQTSKTIEARLLEHQGVRRGEDGRYLGGPSIEGRSPNLNTDLTPEERVFSLEDALAFETEYSKKLENLDYRVLGDGLTDPEKKRRHKKVSKRSSDGGTEKGKSL